MYRKSLSYLKILVCAAFMMVTVSAVSPSAHALVTESSGDGMALYNGHLFPALPDFDDSLRAVISHISDASYIQQYGSEYILLTGQRVGKSSSSGMVFYWLEGTTDTVKLFNFVDGEWVLNSLSGTETMAYINVSGYVSALWSNTDIRIFDSDDLLIAASDPIPLDGLNVITWDGDTTGLEAASPNIGWWRVSPEMPTASQVNGGWLAVSNGEYAPIGAGYIEPEVFESGSGWSIQGIMLATFEDELETNGLTIPLSGTYFMRQSDDIYVSLLAYPASSGGGETPPGEGGDTPVIDFSGTSLTCRLYDLDFQSALYDVDWSGLPVDVPLNTSYFIRGFLSDGRVSSPAEIYIPLVADSPSPAEFSFTNLEPSTSYTATFDLVYNTTGHFYGFTETGVSTEVTFTTAADTGVTDGDKAIINAIENTNKEHESWLDNQMGSAVGDLNEDVSAADQQIDDLNNQEQAYMDDAFSRFQEVSASFSGFDGTVGSGIGLAGTLFSRFFNCLGDYAIIYTFPLILGLAMVIIGRLSRSSFSIEGKDHDQFTIDGW